MMDNPTESQISSREASRTDEQPSNLVTDPDALAKLLEMELALKREEWKRSRSRRGALRALSILFLILVIAGAVAAYFFFATNYRQPAGPGSTLETRDSTR